MTAPLSTRLAECPPEQERELLEELYDACPHAWKGGNNFSRLTAMLDCGAYLSAVEMLVPEGRGFLLAAHKDKSICDIHEKPIDSPGRWYGQGSGATPALALASAIAKAMEARDADKEAQR